MKSSQNGASRVEATRVEGTSGDGLPEIGWIGLYIGILIMVIGGLFCIQVMQ